MKIRTSLPSWSNPYIFFLVLPVFILVAEPIIERYRPRWHIPSWASAYPTRQAPWPQDGPYQKIEGRVFLRFFCTVTGASVAIWVAVLLYVHHTRAAQWRKKERERECAQTHILWDPKPRDWMNVLPFRSRSQLECIWRSSHKEELGMVNSKDHRWECWINIVSQVFDPVFFFYLSGRMIIDTSLWGKETLTNCFRYVLAPFLVE